MCMYVYSIHIYIYIYIYMRACVCVALYLRIYTYIDFLFYQVFCLLCLFRTSSLYTLDPKPLNPKP